MPERALPTRDESRSRRLKIVKSLANPLSPDKSKNIQINGRIPDKANPSAREGTESNGSLFYQDNTKIAELPKETDPWDVLGFFIAEDKLGAL
jgi:hypothetical protein